MDSLISLTTYNTPSNTLQKMGPFRTWISSSTRTNLLLSTENRHPTTFMSTTIPVPLHPPQTVSSDPLQDDSGVTKGPADPAVRGGGGGGGGGILGGRQIVV